MNDCIRCFKMFQAHYGMMGFKSMYDLLMFRDDFPPTLLIFSKQNLPKCQIQPTLTRFHKSLLAKTTNKEQITGNSVGLLQQMGRYTPMSDNGYGQNHHINLIHVEAFVDQYYQYSGSKSLPIYWSLYLEKKTVFPTWGVFPAPPGYSCASKGADWLRSPPWMKGHK